MFTSPIYEVDNDSQKSNYNDKTWKSVGKLEKLSSPTHTDINTTVNGYSP